MNRITHYLEPRITSDTEADVLCDPDIPRYTFRDLCEVEADGIETGRRLERNNHVVDAAWLVALGAAAGVFWTIAGLAILEVWTN